MNISRSSVDSINHPINGPKKLVQTEQKEDGGLGAGWIIVIVVIVLVAAGLIYWYIEKRNASQVPALSHTELG